MSRYNVAGFGLVFAALMMGTVMSSAAETASSSIKMGPGPFDIQMTIRDGSAIIATMPSCKTDDQAICSFDDRRLPDFTGTDAEGEESNPFLKDAKFGIQMRMAPIMVNDVLMLDVEVRRETVLDIQRVETEDKPYYNFATRTMTYGDQIPLVKQGESWTYYGPLASGLVVELKVDDLAKP